MNASSFEPLFLTKQTVLEIHAEQIAEHGGDPAIINEGLLDSAIAQPLTTFEGKYLHEDLFMMAGAYPFSHRAKPSVRRRQ